MEETKPGQEQQNLLLKEGIELMEMGDLSSALQHLKRAAAIGGKSDEIDEKMQQLLKAISLRESEVAYLLKKIGSSSAKDAVQGSENLVNISNIADQCASLIPELDAIFRILSSTSNSAIRDNLIQALKNLSVSKRFTNPLLELISKNQDWWFKDSSYFKESSMLISSVIRDAASQDQFQLEIVLPLIENVFQACLQKESALIGLKCVIMIIVNKEIAVKALNELINPILELSQNQENRSLSIGILSLIFQNLGQDDDDEILFSSLFNALKSKNGTQYFRSLEAIFQAHPDVAFKILKRNNELLPIISNIEIENEDVQISALAVLSAALAVPDLRKAFDLTGLPDLCRLSTNHHVKVLSCLCILKSSMKYEEYLLLIVTKTIVNSEVAQNIKIDCLEALSYLSIFGVAKEILVSDKQLLKVLNERVVDNTNPTGQYAAMSIFSNLVAYPEEKSKEQEQIRKLHEVAKSLPPEDPFNSFENCAKRALLLKDFNVLPNVSRIHSERQNMLILISKFCCDIAMDKNNRGALAQAGFCRILIRIASILKNEGIFACQALARIGITNNPALVFPGEMVVEVVRPLLSIIEFGGLLAQFEGVMALTNLAGYSESVRVKVVNLGGLKLVMDLQFSNNVLIRRAATELICNMIYHEAVYKKFMETNSQILAITTALMDSDDLGTQLAASGTLAVLSSEPSTISFIMKQSRINDILLDLLSSNCEDLVHRAVSIVKNLAAGPVPNGLLEAAKKLVNSKNLVIAEIAMQIKSSS